MNTRDVVLGVLDEVLGLDGRTSEFTDETELFGSLPEFDSISVVSIVTTVEEELGIVIDEGDLTADVFTTVGGLVAFVESQL